WSMIQIAASEGAIEIVKILMEGGADPAFVSMDGVTALHIAARKGLLRIVCMLVARCPVDILTPFGESPLHFAASAGRAKVVAFLLE
ncbi:ankyrin repeat protein, partial [Wilcoxina mikolae CBS 423.85]